MGCLREIDREGADVKCWGRLFQIRAAARGKTMRVTTFEVTKSI